ncbi:hypothetical protein GV794_04140 [Nocardia cyriacigeorgica]|uniref:Secreted protein n=1 Tax=Nocardia cyriacigeorgica TaxID=135487 RepID=A0A6P1DB57_9NOCA|nr:hypothetical protein [Nocardia cyriacigeorgica]NEW40403.1 hypothetical protein [Nocardia cyriacigeorgica]NEW45542.1 hypothetical protein [Nocardia cyriacigeorgica]NEW50649.1 hypothetical protein [Nocardia cyriacigeorgica]NEW54863.1 hypothetical protein [Nocardia cyriacigeorgica]
MSIKRALHTAALAVILGVTVAGATATAAPLALEPAAPVANAPVDDSGTGSASGSADFVLNTLELLAGIGRGCMPGAAC